MSEQPLPSDPSLPPSGQNHGVHDGAGTRRTLAWTALLLLPISAMVVVFWLRGPTQNHVATPDPFPLPPLSSSPFRNTSAEARYVGSEACRSCHPSETKSYHRTGMAISMTEVDLAREAPDTSFDHPPSKRRYQVQRKDGKLWHRELLLTAGPDEVVLCEYPLKYAIGSGRHGRSYVVEAEGFFVESPISWYASRKAWHMSPGYDRADHLGFERAIGEQCLVCHAGQAEAVGKSQHRIHVAEAAIGCERCHGPGSLHVELRKNRKEEADQLVGIDYTIVNPKHLSRELAEAVCQQCHLHSSATVLGRSRGIADFRPGLPLQDFRQDYQLEVDQKPMTVVGHVEQMHLSRCWKESKTLTCTTCHDPHGFPRAEERVAHYQAACAKCHKPEHCKVPAERRQRESPTNHCASCHMPSSDTDVPHVSFTHHRIGIHERRGDPPAEKDGVASLKACMDYPRLGAVDQSRSLGLAYLDLAKDEKNPARAGAYHLKAFDLLSAVHAAGLRDRVVDARLARQHFERGSPQALPLAESALEHSALAGPDRCAALFVLAAERLKRNQHEEARTAFRELVTLRRHPHDWLLLAECEKALGNQAAWAQALATAVRIRPALPQAHQELANHFRRQGDPKRAAWHQKLATP